MTPLDIQGIEEKARQTLDLIAASVLEGQELTPEFVGDAVTRYAHAWLGLSEIGRTNRNEAIDRWNREIHLNPENEYAWCVIFIQHVYLAVSQACGKPDLVPKDTAGSQALATWAEHNGLATIVPAHAQKGSIIVFRDGSSPYGHAEIITAVNGQRYFSVGGNTNSEFSRDGGDVGEHKDVAWGRFGPVGSRRGAKKRWTRCIIPIGGLMRYSWGSNE